MNKDNQQDQPPDTGDGRPAQKRSFGPVADLERFVKPEWWRGIFNELYLKTDGDIVDDPEIARHETDAFCRILGMPAGSRILDLCCGQGRHTLELARRGYDACGLDRSHFLINKAKASARRERLRLRFREGDAKRIPFPADYFDAVVILGNSFGYFESVAEDTKVLYEARRVLRPGGRLLLDVADGSYLREHYTPRSWEWLDNRLFVCRERQLSADGQRLISREVVTDADEGVIADQFYAERLYSRETLTDLLKNAGIVSISIDSIDTASSRNQDLGMMERRFVISGTADKDWTPVSRQKKRTATNVAVILGDPKLCDTVKPQCVFDEDDFITIQRMKEALGALPGYRFIYLDRHETLIADLTRLKPKIDYIFNLCDEGLRNEARYELHVPALLEALGIPYTGSGPQCLAFCYDKSLIRGIAQELGIPVPAGVYIQPGERVIDIPFGYPVIVKPNAGDSSLGITQKSVACTFEELSDAVDLIRETVGTGVPFLVEEFLTGRDISVGIIGTPPACTVLPITEEDYSALPPGLPHICGYEAKWIPESPYARVVSRPAEIAPETEKWIVRCCLLLAQRLGCRDYCRFDWRFGSDGTPRLLEVNPNPGWCWDGHLAKMAAGAGIGYREMLAMILQAAEQRIGIEHLPLRLQTAAVEAKSEMERAI